MTITISVSPQTETKLREAAAAKGTDVTRYAAELVEQALAANLTHANVSANDSLSAWDTFVSEMAKVGQQLPPGTTIDDSRESIYAGRGE
jgi:hypothetical protein